MHSLLIASSIGPRLVALASGGEGTMKNNADSRGTTTHLPAELPKSLCTDSKQALDTRRGLVCLA
jgi:hypothetical protein